MSDQPVVYAGKELPTDLHDRYVDQGELPTAISPADMLEAEEFERLRSLATRRSPLGDEPAKEQQPGLFLG